ARTPQRTSSSPANPRFPIRKPATASAELTPAGRRASARRTGKSVNRPGGARQPCRAEKPERHWRRRHPPLIKSAQQQAAKAKTLGELVELYLRLRETGNEFWKAMRPKSQIETTQYPQHPGSPCTTSQ